MDTILITGTAGFIGFHTAIRLIKSGYNVIGLDNINDYYDVNLKYGRLKETGISLSDEDWNMGIQSTVYNNYTFFRTHLEDKDNIDKIFAKYKFDVVIHLAAQAGVRYSLENPKAYIDSNITGFLNVLEACRNLPPKHLIYASSSSVYGSNTKIPFSESDNVDHPISLYAATKKSNELMAHTYSHLFGIPTTGLRFFTVYGPWGRPDMAIFLFTKAIRNGDAINVFNNGKMLRDFTYIDDVTEGICRLVSKPANVNPDIDNNKSNPSSSKVASYKVFNIGNSKPVALVDFIHAIEKSLNKKAVKIMMPMQPGDVLTTFADTTFLSETIEYRPQTTIETGIKRFVDWFNKFYS